MRAQIAHVHETEIANSNGAHLVDEDVHLVRSSAGMILTEPVRTYPFEVSMSDPEPMEISNTRPDLRELKTVDR